MHIDKVIDHVCERDKCSNAFNHKYQVQGKNNKPQSTIYQGEYVVVIKIMIKDIVLQQCLICNKKKLRVLKSTNIY